MNGPQILDRLKSEDDELREAAEREARKLEGEKVGAVVGGVLALWLLWAITR